MSYLRSYQEILNQIDEIDPISYAKTRNHLAGDVTRLSPYISRGVITLPQIRDLLLERHSKKDCEKLIQELAWREYFQNVWWDKADNIFSDIRFAREDWQHEALVSNIVSATTGIEIIDKAVIELYDTGYIHNHIRMWMASISCNIARAYWHNMGRWMYSNLIDGDLASNFLSWQWVSGTSVNKRYTVNQKLINACSDTEQIGTWLDIAREDMVNLKIPQVLEQTESFDFVMEYPDTEISTVSGSEVCLYTPWTLDPLWRETGINIRRILVVDHVWFDRYPVSELVFDFIVRQGQTVINDLEVYTGHIKNLPGIEDASAIYFKNHQTNQHWPGYRGQSEKLFPNVSGYYPSFFKFWEQVKN